jgi:hypothetical protein
MIFVLCELDSSDWLETFLHKTDSVPVETTNASSLPVTSTVPRKDSPNTPSKKSKEAITL